MCRGKALKNAITHITFVSSVTSLAGTYQYKKCAQAWHKIRLPACSLCSTNEQDEQGMLALLDERARRARYARSARRTSRTNKEESH